MRVIRKNSSRSATDVLELLSSVFAVETLQPSRCLWIVSPWMTDLPILDNRFGNFPVLEAFGQRRITLAEVLVAMANRSGRVVIATRDDPINKPFVSRVTQLAKERNVTDRVAVVLDPLGNRMHEKALTGDDFVISGSMNFTFSGVMLNQEQVQFHTDPAMVAQTKRELFRQFGGDLG